MLGLPNKALCKISAFSFKGLSKCFYTAACWELSLFTLTDRSCLFPSVYSFGFIEISFSFFPFINALAIFRGSTSCQVQTQSWLPQDLIWASINLLGNTKCVLLSPFAKSLLTFHLLRSLLPSHTVEFVRVGICSVCCRSSPDCRVDSLLQPYPRTWCACPNPPSFGLLGALL